MNLDDVMDEIATRLDTIAGLRCFAWPPGTATPPAAIVSYPNDYTYDETYGRGMDRMTLPVVVLVGRPTDRSTRDALAQYVNGSGAASVKAVLESGTYTALHTLRVMSADFDVYQLGGTDYLAAIFELDIAGQGS
jgi:hypothetical protein